MDPPSGGGRGLGAAAVAAGGSEGASTPNPGGGIQVGAGVLDVMKSKHSGWLPGALAELVHNARDHGHAKNVWIEPVCCAAFVAPRAHTSAWCYEDLYMARRAKH